MQKAKEAAEKTNKAIEEEQGGIANLLGGMQNILIEETVPSRPLQEEDIIITANETNPTKNNVKVTIKIADSVEGELTLQYVIKEKKAEEEELTELQESDWQEYEKEQEINVETNGQIYARAKDNNGQVVGTATKEIKNIDKKAPKEFNAEIKESTTNSITVQGQTTDETTAGYEGEIDLTYYFKITSSDGGNVPQGEWLPENGVKPTGETNAEYKFEGLTQGKTYTVKMKAVDVAENATESELKTQKLANVPNLSEEGKVTFTNSTNNWTNGVVTVTITCNASGYDIYYTKENPTNGLWTKYSQGTTITFETNGNIYAKLKDSAGQEGGYATGTITNIDKTPPNISGNITAQTTTANSITPKLTATDDASGIAKVEWQYKKSSEADYKSGTTSTFITDKSTTGEKNKVVTGSAITNLSPATNYDIKAKIYDVAGNHKDVANVTLKTNDIAVTSVTVNPNKADITEGESTTLTATITPGNATNQQLIWTTNTDGIVKITSNGNTATVTALKAGNTTITVKSQANTSAQATCTITVKSKFITDGSYDEKGKVNSPKLGTGMKAITWNGSAWVEPKTNEEWYNYSEHKWANAQTEDGSYWVWIPRYAYRITSGYHTSTQGVIDIKFLKGTTNSDGNNTNIVASLSSIAQSGTSGPSTVANQYVIHPAFKWGTNNQAISGIWVAKFEASRLNATATNEGSGQTIKIQPSVQSWRNITINDIFTKCENYNAALNSHLMKNSEWGAVAYLAHSNYGLNGQEIGMNTCSNYITGAGPKSGTTTYPYSADNFETTYSYKTTNGKKASTTGNVYGIYDMSGGSWEYVAGYVNNGNGNLTTNGQSVVNAEEYEKDVYKKSDSGDRNTNNYNANTSKYGDAVYETSSSGNSLNSWYGDYSYFPLTGNPFFVRGGGCSFGAGAGLWHFRDDSGAGYIDGSFRPVLVAL